MSGYSFELERLGQYRLLEKLGAGAMGTVFKAESDDGELVAIKVVHPHLVERVGFFQRFQREAEAGQRVNHENVVRTLDCDFVWLQEMAVCFLVMEHVDGVTLREMTRDLGTVPERMLREVAAQTASGLSAIHAEGIVHRDLKPENILIAEDQKVRIMDLGVAKIQDAETLTRDGQFAGSLLYAAPEQIHQEEVGPWTDLYSLGVMLFELGTGHNPFRRSEPVAMLRAHLELTPPRMNEKSSVVSAFLSEIVATLLEKNPEQRFRSAESLREVLSRGERSEWWSAREPDLLKTTRQVPRIGIRRETEIHGREAELALVRSAWDRAKGGKGSTLLLEGEAGIGKTRLVDALLTELSGEDAHVLYGSYPPSGGVGGLSEAITSKFGMAGLAEALRSYLSLAPGLAPPLAAILKHEAPPTGSERLPPDALQAALCHLLRGLAAEKPTVWVVDDLHFAEPEARHAVLAMGRTVAEQKVLLLVTTRPDLPDEDFANFRQIRSFERLPLGRLSPRQVIELLRDAFRSETLADKLGAKIAYKSDGVPFFIFEMIRELREKEFIRELDSGSYVESHVIDDIEVPSAVRDLIDARLGDLGIEERILLDVAAVQGYEFDADLLAKAADEKIVKVLQGLAAIERASGVVRASGPLYRFDHHQIQEVVYADLPDRLRREYHSQLAEAFAALEDVDTSALADLPGETCWYLAAHHFRGSRPWAGVPYLDRALDHLESSFGNESAIRLVDLAVSTGEVLTPGARIDALLRKGGLQHLLGRWDQARETAQAALEIAESTSDDRARVRALCKLGESHVFGGRAQDGVPYLEQALEVARETGDLKGEGLASGRLGNAAYCLSRLDEARESFERHLRISEEMDDRHGVAAATGNLGNLATMSGHLDQGEDLFRRALELMREVGDRRGEAVSLGNIANICVNTGRSEEARELYGRYLELSQQIGYRRGECLAIGNLGNVFADIGWFEVARDQFERYLVLSREMGDTQGEANALSNLGQVLVELGATSDALSRFDASHDLCAEIGQQQFLGYAFQGRGAVAEAEGRIADALEHYEEAYRIWEEIGYPHGTGSAVLSRARTLVRAERGEEAKPLLVEAAETGRRLGMAVMPVVATAYMAVLSGDPEEALREFEKDGDRISHLGKIEARYLLWRATGDRAHLDSAVELLDYLREHSPEDHRASMVERYPLYRDVVRESRELP